MRRPGPTMASSSTHPPSRPAIRHDRAVQAYRGEPKRPAPYNSPRPSRRRRSWRAQAPTAPQLATMKRRTLIVAKSRAHTSGTPQFATMRWRVPIVGKFERIRWLMGALSPNYGWALLDRVTLRSQTQDQPYTSAVSMAVRQRWCTAGPPRRGVATTRRDARGCRLAGPSPDHDEPHYA